MRRIAVILASTVVLVVASLAGSADADSGSSNNSGNGITQHFTVFWNVQDGEYCDIYRGHTAYKMTKATVKWTRSNSDVILTDPDGGHRPKGKVGQVGEACDDSTYSRTVALTMNSGQSLCFGCGSLPANSTTKFTYNGFGFKFSSGYFPERDSIGGWHQSYSFRRGSGSGTKICSVVPIEGIAPGCDPRS